MRHRGYRQSFICWFFIVIIFHPSIIQGSQSQQKRQPQRVGAPVWITCPRNNLTLYNGKVLSLFRTKGRTIIRIRTDYETTERVTILHARTATPQAWFRLNGEPFRQSDWSLIESRRNHLKPNVRANIWVCDEGTNAIVDWQPPE